MPFKPQDILLFTDLIQTASDRGEIAMRIDQTGMALTFELPGDMVNDEAMANVVRAFGRRFETQEW